MSLALQLLRNCTIDTNPYKLSHFRAYDVWPGALLCQMAYYTEHAPTAHYKTAFLQMALRRIYTHFVRSACHVKNGLYVASACST